MHVTIVYLRDRLLLHSYCCIGTCTCFVIFWQAIMKKIYILCLALQLGTGRYVVVPEAQCKLLFVNYYNIMTVTIIYQLGYFSCALQHYCSIVRIYQFELKPRGKSSMHWRQSPVHVHCHWSRNTTVGCGVHQYNQRKPNSILCV